MEILITYCILSKNNMCAKVSNFEKKPITGWPKLKFVNSNGCNYTNMHFEPKVNKANMRLRAAHFYGFISCLFTIFKRILGFTNIGPEMLIFKVIAIWIGKFWFASPCTNVWQVLFQAVVLHKIAFFSYFAKLFCREIPHNMATRRFSVQGATWWKILPKGLKK